MSGTLLVLTCLGCCILLDLDFVSFVMREVIRIQQGVSGRMAFGNPIDPSSEGEGFVSSSMRIGPGLGAKSRSERICPLAVSLEELYAAPRIQHMKAEVFDGKNMQKHSYTTNTILF